MTSKGPMMLREILRRVAHTAHELFIAVDQLANVLIFAFNLGTYADETLSARAWRQSRTGRPLRWAIFRRVIDVLFIWQDAALWMSGRHDGRMHCQRTFDAQRRRYGLHPQYNQPESAS